MIGFIIGLFVGAFLGVLAVGLCLAASKGNEIAEDITRNL